jgi:hypothetical protein
MNRKEIIERVTEHLLGQGVPSVAGNDVGYSCAYRGADGLKCAVGCLITDEAYTPDLEGEGVRNPLVVAALEKSGIECTPSILNLLNELQEIHDFEDPEAWAARLEKVS